MYSGNGEHRTCDGMGLEVGREFLERLSPTFHNQEGL